MAGTKTTRMLLVTANIASCFEQPDIMLMPWINEFLKTITQLEPRFIALHCQEVGGKNYESSMQHVEHFVRALMGRGAMLPYDRIRVFLDEEYTSAEKFTALGNMYFIHEDVEDIQIWDFKENKYVECVGKREYAGNIEEVTTKEKAKFPQEFFPECKWSRKGFMRTRWCLNGTKFDMVNIHLFHDASNVVAMESYPSVYCLNRKRALEHTLDRFHNDGFERVPFFMFGDFNFRLDTQGVVKKLTQSCSNDVGEVPDTGEKTTDFKDKDGKMVLTVSKKGFKHNDHHNIFLKDNGSWMREFDKELTSFGDRLYEYQIHFPPSYPFEEGIKGEGQHYMQTRCPSWCDRIILNKAAKELVDRANGEVKYNLIGLSTRMGDHKPVSLCVEVPMGAGTVSCCSPARPCPNFVHDPRAPCFLSAGWCLCQSYPACPRPIKTTTSSSSGVQPSSSFPYISPSPCIPPVPTLCSVVGLAGGGEENSHINGNAALCEKDEKKSGQCVCSTGASEEKISACHCSIHGNNLMQSAGIESHDLLRNLLLLNSERARILVESSFKDSGLKRVNSETFAEKFHRAEISKEDLDMCHTRLVASRSLDTARNNQAFSTNSKLRLRATSSRFLSHHSSSTEEWFEEVLDDQEEGLVSGASRSATANVEVKSKPDVLQMSPIQVQVDVSQDDDTSFRSPSPQNIGKVSASVSLSGSNSRGGDVNGKRNKVSDTAQHSLNNLLLSDSCDHLVTTNQYNKSESSLSALCSEDCVSYSSRANRDGETVSQAPTYNIADMDLVDLVGVVKVPNKCQSDVIDPLPQSSAERSPSPANCCCVLS